MTENKGIYISLEMSDESQEKIINIFNKNGLEEYFNNFKFHVTIVYDKEFSEEVIVGTTTTVPYYAIIDGYKELGKDTQWQTIAMLLNSPSIKIAHLCLEDLLGTKWGFPNYLCHMSCGYQLSEDVNKKIINIISNELVGETITFDKVTTAYLS